MKNYNLLYSFSFAVISVATLTGGALFVDSNKGKIGPDPIPVLLPHERPRPTAPVDPTPSILEFPDTTAPTITAPKVVKVLPLALKAKIAVLPKEKVMICNEEWQTSNYGGQYRICEMK